MAQQNSSISELETARDESLRSMDYRQRHDFSLVEVLTRFAYRKWLIAKFTVASAALAVILAFVLPVRYAATTKMMPPQQAPSSAALLTNQLANGSAGSLSLLAGLGAGLKSPNDVYIGMLTARPIADAIIDKFQLVKVYRSKDRTAARKELARNTDVISEKSGFISVSVSDRDRQRAADMANAYTGELRALTKDLAVTEASQRRLYFETQLSQAKDALVAAEGTFQQVQQSKGLVQLDAQAKGMIEELGSLRAQVAAREVEIESMRTYSTEQNPKLQIAEQELSSLKGQVARFEGRNGGPGFTNIGLEDVPGAGMDYLRAEHELAYRRALYDMLMKQYDAAKLDESRDATIIQVVEPAIPPDRKSSPKRILIVLLITACGFFLSCVSVLVMWWNELVDAEPELSKQKQELKRALLTKKQSTRVAV
jgi:tyrosine-protein kinase Etk/Wzc